MLELFNCFTFKKDKTIILDTIDIEMVSSNIRNKMINYYRTNKTQFDLHFNDYNIVTDFNNYKFITLYSLSHSHEEIETYILQSPYKRLYKYIDY
jgi:hypothetical protein